MTYQFFEDEHYYTCHDGRELRHIRTESREQEGYTQTIEVYGCADYSGCEYKSWYLYKYNPEKNADWNKVMKINERWEELKKESNANIQSEKGILKRQTHSIQTKGTLGISRKTKTFGDLSVKYSFCSSGNSFKRSSTDFFSPCGHFLL